MIQENKQTRQFIIKDILSSSPIPNQDSLRLELRKRGLKVTQATLSRDLKELGVSRSASSAGTRYVPREEDAVKALSPLIREEVISVNSNECMIVVNTLPGCANIAGEFIDVQKNPDIIGTLAGDNTLVVIPSSRKRIKQITKFIETLFLEGKP